MLRLICVLALCAAPVTVAAGDLLDTMSRSSNVWQENQRALADRESREQMIYVASGSAIVCAGLIAGAIIYSARRRKA